MKPGHTAGLLVVSFNLFQSDFPLITAILNIFLRFVALKFPFIYHRLKVAIKNKVTGGKKAEIVLFVYLTDTQLCKKREKKIFFYIKVKNKLEHFRTELFIHADLCCCVVYFSSD